MSNKGGKTATGQVDCDQDLGAHTSVDRMMICNMMCSLILRERESCVTHSLLPLQGSVDPFLWNR